jgi:tRNA(Ser,Leu) C12 N-acetylase TAN1
MGVALEFTGDDAKLMRMYERMAAKQTESIEKTMAAMKATDELSRSEEKLEQAAKRVFDSIATPQEKFNAQIERLNTLLKENKISVETYGRAVDQQASKLKQAEDAAKSLAAENQNAFGKAAIGHVIEFAGALGLVTTASGAIGMAINLAKKEFEDFWETERRFKETTLSTADAEIGALRNLGVTTDKDRDKYKKFVTDLSAETGVSQKDIWARVSDSVSAKGALSDNQMLDAVAASTLLVPESTEKGRIAAGASLDISKITGATAKESLGFLTSVQKTARIPDTRALAEAFPPVLTAGMQAGATPVESGALYSALTQGMADSTGKVSQFAFIQMVESMRDYLPKAGSFKERMTMLQSNPALRDKFMKGMEETATAEEEKLAKTELPNEHFKNATIRARARGTIREILKNKGPSAEAYSSFVKELPTMQAAGTLFDARTKVIAGSKLQQTARVNRMFTGTVEGLELSDQDKAQAAIAREKMERILKDTDLGAVATTIANMPMNMQGSEAALGESVKTIRSRKQELEHPSRTIHTHTPMGGVTTREQYRQPTEKESDQAAQLGNLADKLDIMIDELKKQTAQAPKTKTTLGIPEQSGHNDK